jgi:CRP-like cAMP-binding protein
VGLIRRLLVTEANIGILRNNLNACNVSARLRKAWEAEIAERQAESQRLRQQMGTSVFAYMSSLFPSHDETTWAYLQEQFARHDPTMVHTFDMFMRMTELAKRFTPTQLEAMAQRLSRIDIFRQISLADLENLSRAVEFAEFTDGEMLFDKGDEGDAMYLIESGAIKIYALDHGQREKYLRTYSAGQVVGDFSVLDGEKRSARARVHGNLAVMVLRRTVFQMFIQSRPQVILAVLVVLAERGRYTTRAVETSIQTLSGIARGDYTCALPQTSSLSGEPVASEVPGNLTSLVEHSLAQYAALLQVREEATG